MSAWPRVAGNPGIWAGAGALVTPLSLLHCPVSPGAPCHALPLGDGVNHIFGHKYIYIYKYTCVHSLPLEHSAVSSGSALALHRFPPPFPFFSHCPITPCPGWEGGAQKHSDALSTALGASSVSPHSSWQPGTHPAPSPEGRHLPAVPGVA